MAQELGDVEVTLRVGGKRLRGGKRCLERWTILAGAAVSISGYRGDVAIRVDASNSAISEIVDEKISTRVGRECQWRTQTRAKGPIAIAGEARHAASRECDDDPVRTHTPNAVVP